MIAYLSDKSTRYAVIGYNTYEKSHPLTIQTTDSYLVPKHAEIDAIAKFTSRYGEIKNLSLYVTGITRSLNLLANTKPCKLCMATIKQFDITRIVFYENGILTELEVDEYHDKVFPIECNSGYQIRQY
jgi:tRNA(Arg) A34 adenosine deaminase TadA